MEQNLLFIFLMIQPYFQETLQQCQTPNEWMGVGVASINYKSSKRKWPNGVVKYQIDSSVPESNKTFIYQAFEEYHQKTCIKFVEKTDTDESYVSIEYIPDMSGAVAEVCMKGRRQYLRYGSDLCNKETIVHELGHTICLGHEHQRSDRDKYIFANESCHREIYEIQANRPVRGIYDYTSQMHYKCQEYCLIPKNEHVPGCGDDVNKGLSVLDADYINELYNCQGCHSHQWVPAYDLGFESARHLQHFTSKITRKLTVCRALVKNEVLVGYYKFQSCWTMDGKAEHNITKDFEVLYIPSNSETERYFLLDMDESTLSSEEKKMYLKHAVSAGYHMWTEETGYKTVYVGFGNISNSQLLLDNVNIGSANINETQPILGAVWLEGNNFRSRFSVGNHKFQLFTYKILICKPVTIAENDPFLVESNENQFLKYIGRDLVDGATLQVNGIYNLWAFSIDIFDHSDNLLGLFLTNMSSVAYVRLSNGSFDEGKTHKKFALSLGERIKIDMVFETKQMTMFLQNVAVQTVSLEKPFLNATYLLIEKFHVIFADLKFPDKIPKNDENKMSCENRIKNDDETSTTETTISWSSTTNGS